MHELYEHFSIGSNIFVVGNQDTDKTEFIKKYNFNGYR